MLYVPAACTSQRCSEQDCGHISARNRLDRDTFECEHCASRWPADHNAARNVEQIGMAALETLLLFLQRTFLAAGTAVTACETATRQRAA